MRRRRTFITIAAVALLLPALAVAAYAIAGSGDEQRNPNELSLLDFDSLDKPAPHNSTVGLTRDPEEKYSYAVSRKSARGQKKAGIPEASSTRRVAAGAPSDAELKGELRRERKNGVGGAGAVTLLADGTAQAPFDAPPEVQNVVAAANAIADFPYIWGGGHGSFSDVGYDCSGSVSYALRGAGLVSEPLASGQFMDWGDKGKGKWITVYANGGHMFMIVGGLRFDTSFRDGPRGSRWQTAPRSMNGFEVRHWPGL